MYLSTAIKWSVWAVLCCACFMADRAAAQPAPYMGGPGDGYGVQAISNFAPQQLPAALVYMGGSGNGYRSVAITLFSPSPLDRWSPYYGAAGNGYQSAAITPFSPSPLDRWSPYYGAAGNGYSSQQQGNFIPGRLAIYGPYAGGGGNGYQQALRCGYPLNLPDTLVLIACIDQTINLNNVYGGLTGLQNIWTAGTPAAAPAGTYTLFTIATPGCSDTAVVIVAPDIARWTGTTSNDWHNPQNWNTGKVPTAFTHAIIETGTPNICTISTANAQVASIQLRGGATVQALNNRQILVAGRCVSLPAN